MSKELEPYEQAVRLLTKAIENIPTRAGTMAVNFVKERFTQKNWLDETAEAWKKTSAKKKKQGSLLVQSGQLKRSIRKIVQGNRVIIATNVPYARIHNQGGVIRKTVRIKSYVKNAYIRTRKGRKANVKAHNVKSHRRSMNLTVIKRQFLGNSETLNKRIQNLIQQDIEKALSGLGKV